MADRPQATHVVVKVVRGGIRARAERAAARHLIEIEHPDLLPVLARWDDPEPGSEPGLVSVMPYVPGGTLRHLMDQRGALSAGEVVALLAPVATVLERLSAHGLVHGDLKPENILLRSDGRPVVTDVVGASGLASPGYLAPELADPSRPADERSDVFALAVIAYELLTTRRPHGPDLERALAAAAGGSHRPLASWATVPAPVAEVVERGLSADPEHRPPNGSALVAELTALVDRHEVVLPGGVPSPVAVSERSNHTVEITGAPRPPSHDDSDRPRARLLRWPIRRRSRSRRCP